MSIDYLSCKHCGEGFPDCCDYVGCDCGESWCSDECAEEDGYKETTCDLNNDEDECNICEYCEDCEYLIDSTSTCKYCREEDFEDDKLLEFLLKQQNKTRNQLTEEYKNNIKGGN